MPDLLSDHATVADRQRLIYALVWHQHCISQGVSPPVCHAVHAGRVLHEHACFQAAVRGCDAICQFDLEVLNPNRAIWKTPSIRGGKPDLRFRIRDAKPTCFVRMIRPEGHIDIIGNQTGMRRQRLQISENTRVAECLWKWRRLVHRHINQAFEQARPVVNNQEITIARIYSKGSNVGLTRQMLRLSNTADIRPQCADFARDIVAENVLTFQPGNL